MNRILLVLLAIFAMGCAHRPMETHYYTMADLDNDPPVPWPDGHPWPR